MRCALMMLLCLAWSGCNTILGIDEPLDVVANDGGNTADAIRHDSDTDTDQDAGELLDAGRAPIADSYARPRWPMPNPAGAGAIHPQTYTVEGDLVLDAVTGLTWERAASETSMPWSDAYAYCRNLVYEGRSFRLPSRIELVSLLDLTQEGAAIDSAAFPETPPEGFWSSSRSAGATHHAWGVNFGFSTSVTFQDDIKHERRVRCVRSPESEPELSHFAVHGDVIEDTATQLQWQRDGLTTQDAWDAAGLYCDNLDLAGTEWRLPTLKELHTLIDETRENPAADSSIFPGIANGYYWTQSQPRGFANMAWTLGFDRGLDVFRDITSTAFVRCVR